MTERREDGLGPLGHWLESELTFIKLNLGRKNNKKTLYYCASNYLCILQVYPLELGYYKNTLNQSNFNRFFWIT